MRMRAIGAILMVLALGATPALAGPDGAIDLFANAIDPGTGVTGAVDFGACQASATNVLGFFSKVAFSVYARLDGPTAAGISGAEFFIEGLLIGTDLTATTTVVYTSPAGTTALGSPTQTTDAGLPTERQRLNLTWAVDDPSDVDCQKAPLTYLGLVEVQTQFGAAGDLDGVRRVGVVAANPPTNPTVAAPALLLCDSPFYTIVEVTGGQFIINPDAQNSCAVAVNETTWGSLKGLYR